MVLGKVLVLGFWVVLVLGIAIVKVPWQVLVLVLVLLRRFPKVLVLVLGRNFGIAHLCNQACQSWIVCDKLLLKSGCDHIESLDTYCA